MFVSVYMVGENDVGPYICQVLDQNYTVDISSKLQTFLFVYLNTCEVSN